MKDLEIIENKVKELHETLQKKNSFLSNVKEALKKLSKDKEVTIGEIHTIQGAIHGYSESLRVLSPCLDKSSQLLPVSEK